MGFVVQTAFCLFTFLLQLQVAFTSDGLKVYCYGKENITIHSPNTNFSNKTLQNCSNAGKVVNSTTVVIPSNCSKQIQKNITVVTLYEWNNKKENEVNLIIVCRSSEDATVYRIADGSEFTRKTMQFEVGDIDMRFKTGLELNSEDLSQVYIGDQFYMTMQYIGSSSYTPVPIGCYAYDGNIASDTTNYVEIWNQSSCVVPVGIVVMENFSYTADDRLYAKMYGFKFNGTHTNDITIRCQLKICRETNSTGGNCGLKLCKTTRSLKKNRIAHRAIKIVERAVKTNAACYLEHRLFLIALSVAYIHIWIFSL